MAPRLLLPGGLAVATAALLSASGCNRTTPPPAPPPDVTTLPTKPLTSAGPEVTVIGGHAQRTSPLITPGPSLPSSTGGTNEPPPNSLPQLQGPPVTVTVENMPLPTFINTVLGETLHLNFQIDPQLATRTDLVTLRTGGARSPQELLSITAVVLRNYGVQMVFEKNLVRVRPNEALASEAPQIILGRTAPDIASTLRPIFQVVPLTQVGAQDMAGWLATAYGNKIRFTLSPSNNAIMMLGPPEDVRSAVEAIRLLDQPQFGDRRSLRIRPVFWSAASLAEKLIDVLKAEGINASSNLQPPSAVTVLPLSSPDTILVFARDNRALEHISSWVKTLDQASEVDPDQSTFYYPVRNTTAESLAKVLNEVLIGGENAASDRSDTVTRPPVRPQTQTAGQSASALPREDPAQPPASAPRLPPGSRFVTDTARNALIFLGTPDAYARVRPLIESLDQAPREVLIEVTVLQVKLDDSTDLGIEWSQSLGLGSGIRATVGTIGGLGVPQSGSGFNIAILNSAGQVRDVLQTLQTNNKTRVLSTPRILAQSGGSAKIQVGSDVPIVTGQATTAQAVTGGNSDILQQIQYRSIGTIIEVKPVIYAGNQIDLDIRQELSDVAQTQISNINSPTFDNQNVATQLSISDGATVLLGGFIMDQKTDNDTGLPGLKDLPLLGHLFKNTQISDSRTELLVFITPYVINSTHDSDQITDAFKDRLRDWPELRSTLTW